MLNIQQNQQQAIVIPEEIRDYLLAVLHQANVLPVTEEMKNTMLGDLYRELDKYTTAKIIENMPIQYLEAFLDLQRQGKPQELEAFIVQQIPNSQQVYIDSFNEFRTIYVENVAKARAARG